MTSEDDPDDFDRGLEDGEAFVAGKSTDYLDGFREGLRGACLGPADNFDNPMPSGTVYARRGSPEWEYFHDRAEWTLYTGTHGEAGGPDFYTQGYHIVNTTDLDAFVLRKEK
jgi:hypothetical protein